MENNYVKRLENAFLMAYDLAGIDASPLPEALPESAYTPGYMDKVRELREVFALASKPDTQTALSGNDRNHTVQGQASEPKCVCFAPPTEQHSSYCPREGMDYDPEPSEGVDWTVEAEEINSDQG